MIKLKDETKGKEVSHFFIDLDNPNTRYAYSSYEDMKEDLKAFGRDKNDINENTEFFQIDNFSCGEISRLKDWELTNDWEVKEGKIRVRKDG